MKKIYLILLVNFLFIGSFSAQVGIRPASSPGIPDASSVLDINFTNKGLLIPQYDLLDVNSAVSPVLNPTDGLLIVNKGGASTHLRGLYIWIVDSWRRVIYNGTEPELMTLKITNPNPDYPPLSGNTYFTLIPQNSTNNVLSGFSVSVNNILGASLASDTSSITLPAGTYLIKYGVDAAIPVSGTGSPANTTYMSTQPTLQLVCVKSTLTNSAGTSITDQNNECNFSPSFASFFGTYIITLATPTVIKQRFEFDNAGGNGLHDRVLALRTSYLLTITKMTP